MKTIICISLFLLSVSLSFGQSGGVVNGSRAFPQPNDGSTGTTLNGTAIINSAAQAINATTGNTSVPTYVVVGGSGTVGNAALAEQGTIAPCTMDSTIASAAGGFYVINSPTVASECHAQSAAPASGTWVIGFLASSSTATSATSLVAINSFIFAVAAGGTPITGSGTPGFIPEFTGASALGNSPVQDTSGSLQSSEGLFVSAIPGIGLQATRQPTSCSGLATPSFDYNANTIRCQTAYAVLNAPAASTGTLATILGFASTTASLSATPAIAGVYGVNLNTGGGSAKWQAGTVGFASDTGASGTTANMFGVFGLASQGGSGQTATVLAGVGGQAEQGSTTNASFGAALLAYAPNIVLGNFTHNYGLYIQDQTTGGGSDPWGIFEAGTGKNQFGGVINGVAGFQQNGTALALSCGTTTTCASTATPTAHWIFGTVALSGGTATVGSISPAFTSTSTFVCTGTDATAAAAVKIVNASSSSITLTGTGTDTVGYQCVGT